MSERRATQAVLEPASSPRRVSERLAANPWVRRLAVLGYVAKGLLYIVTGGTAVLALMQVGGRVRGTRGALDLLVASPFGRLAAVLVAVGLFGYILRRFVQVFVQPAEGEPPRPITRVMRRIGFALSGLAHAATPSPRWS